MIRAEVEGVGTLEFPDGTDPLVIQATVKRVAAKNAVMPKGWAKYRAREDEELQRPNPIESAGRGFMDLAQGVKQAYLDRTDPAAGKAYQRDVGDEIARYSAGRGKDAGFDVSRFVGNTLAALPATAAIATAAPAAATATVGGRLVLGGIQGLVQGGSEYVPEGGSRVINAGLGTAGGVVGGVGGEIISRVVAKLTQGAQRAGARLTTSPDEIVNAIQGELQRSGVDWNKLTTEVKSGLMQQARRQLSVTGELSPDMLARKLEMEDVLGPGAGPTQAQVTRNPQEWSWERNTQKVQDIGGPLTERYQAQIQRLQQRLDGAIAERQAKAQNAYQAGEAATKAIEQKMAESKKVVDDLYTVWRETGSGGTEVKPQKIADTLGRVTEEYGVENIAPAVRARLESFGMLGGKQTKLLTIDEAEKLRKLIGNNIDPANKPQAGAMSILKRSIDDAVMETDAPDIPSLQAARKTASERFGMRDSAKAVTVAAEGVEPDRYFQKFVLNGDVRDLRGIKAVLTTDMAGAKASPQGAQAWQDLQAQTLRHLMEKAKNTGDDAFSGRAFEKALKEIGDERLKVLFPPDQVESLKKLARVANNVGTEPNFAAVNRSNTAPTMMQYAGDVTKKLASLPFVKPFALPFIGAAEMGAKSLKDTQLRQKVAQALDGSPIDASGASDAYGELVKLLTSRLDPVVASAATTGTLYGTQQR